MMTVMVRYRVKPERVTENEELVHAVYAELAEREPDGMTYATFKLDDGVSFVHVFAGAGDALPQVAAFRRFREGLAERCDEPPVRTEMTAVGTYRAAVPA